MVLKIIAQTLQELLFVMLNLNKGAWPNWQTIN